MLKKLFQTCFQNKLGFVVVVLGSLSWSLVSIRSGLFYNSINGLGFWGPHGHDAIWHLAIINSLSHFSLQLPIYAGHSLTNYHFAFDVFLALLHKISFIPVSILYFQIFPVISSLLIGFLVYYFVLKVGENKIAASLSTFFVYFGGNWAWVLGKGESTFWSQQSISTLINPPFTLSLIVLMLALILLIHKKYFYSAVLFGILIQTKAYIGVLVLVSLLIVGVINFFKKNNSDILQIFSTAFFVSVLLSIPFFDTQQIFVFKPFWFLESMMASNDRLYWPKYAQALLNYNLAQNYVRLSIFYFFAFLVFLFGNLGTRFFAFFYKSFSDVILICVLIILGGIMAPMLFVQSATPWNTIQFFYYSLFFLSIFTGISISRFKPIVIVFILLLTIPTSLVSLKNFYLTKLPASKLSNEELLALNFLKSQKNGLVLTYPFDQNFADKADKSKPRDLYLYETTSYVSAYSNKSVFLEDEINLSILNINYEERKNNIKDFFEDYNYENQKSFLVKNNISYIYIPKSLFNKKLDFNILFDNDSVRIYNLNTND